MADSPKDNFKVSFSKGDRQAVKWYAMSATYRSELKIKEFLDAKGVECFLPLVMGFRVVNRRRVKKLVPAVGNLIFVRSSQERIDDLKISQPRWQYKMMPCEAGTKRVVIPDGQMVNFIAACGLARDRKNFLDPSTFDFSRIDIHKGDKVRITRDDGTQIDGCFVSIKGNRKRYILIDAGNVLAVKLDEDSVNYTIEKL